MAAAVAAIPAKSASLFFIGFSGCGALDGLDRKPPKRQNVPPRASVGSYQRVVVGGIPPALPPFHPPTASTWLGSCYDLRRARHPLHVPRAGSGPGNAERRPGRGT